MNILGLTEDFLTNYLLDHYVMYSVEGEEITEENIADFIDIVSTTEVKTKKAFRIKEKRKD